MVLHRPIESTDVIIHMVGAQRWAEHDEIQARSRAESEALRTSDHWCDSHASFSIFRLAAEHLARASRRGGREVHLCSEASL